jgi:hypothetical protein
MVSVPFLIDALIVARLMTENQMRGMGKGSSERIGKK